MVKASRQNEELASPVLTLNSVHFFPSENGWLLCLAHIASGINLIVDYLRIFHGNIYYDGKK